MFLGLFGGHLIVRTLEVWRRSKGRNTIVLHFTVSLLGLVPLWVLAHWLSASAALGYAAGMLVAVALAHSTRLVRDAMTGRSCGTIVEPRGKAPSAEREQ
ncbi:MAG TPA: hypothetical protein VF041_04640 [Gemmatimonadaceae bacterium]